MTVSKSPVICDGLLASLDIGLVVASESLSKAY